MEPVNQENQRISLLETNLDKIVSLLSKHLMGEGEEDGRERSRKMEEVLANLTGWVEGTKESKGSKKRIKNGKEKDNVRPFNTGRNGE